MPDPRAPNQRHCNGSGWARHASPLRNRRNERLLAALLELAKGSGAR
jgi:hypothetical protein